VSHSITPTPPEYSLDQVTPTYGADFLNYSQEEKSEDIVFVQNIEETSLAAKTTNPKYALALENHIKSHGKSPEFNPCKLLHMNFAYKV